MINAAVDLIERGAVKRLVRHKAAYPGIVEKDFPIFFLSHHGKLRESAMDIQFIEDNVRHTGRPALQDSRLPVSLLQGYKPVQIGQRTVEDILNIAAPSLRDFDAQEFQECGIYIQRSHVLHRCTRSEERRVGKEC